MFKIQKIVVTVELSCCKCRKTVMKLVASIAGINSIVLDPSKGTVTIIGVADPAIIIKKVRTFQRSARLDSVGPPPKADPKAEDKDKKDSHPELPKTCQRCDTWIMINEYPYGPCSIL